MEYSEEKDVYKSLVIEDTKYITKFSKKYENKVQVHRNFHFVAKINNTFLFTFTFKNNNNTKKKQ